MWEMIGALSRWLLFAGLLTAFGAVVFRVAILPRVPDSRAAEGAGFDAARAAGRLGLTGTMLVMLAAAGRLGEQITIFRDPFEPFASELSLLLMQTSWGKAWIGQVAFASLGAGAFAFAIRSRRIAGELGWVAAAAAVVLLSYTPAFSGHAAGAEHYVTAAISADVLHVMAGGTWLGTLAVMAGVVRAGRRSGDPVPRRRVIGWIEALSPLALGSAAVIGATGVFGAWLHLDAFSSLWAHPYGRRLSLKLGLLVVVLAGGAYNWKRSRGRVAASGDPPRLPPSVALELSAGLALLLVTAILVATPPPAH